MTESEYMTKCTPCNGTGVSSWSVGKARQSRSQIEGFFNWTCPECEGVGHVLTPRGRQAMLELRLRLEGVE